MAVNPFDRARDAVLYHHEIEKGWKVFDMNRLAIPGNLPYSDSMAWSVTLSKEYNEMSDDDRQPAGMNDHERAWHQCSLPREWTRSYSAYCMDVVIITSSNELYLFSVSKKQTSIDAGISFAINFPLVLSDCTKL
jgi:hypothetical protein